MRHPRPRHLQRGRPRQVRRMSGAVLAAERVPPGPRPAPARRARAARAGSHLRLGRRLHAPRPRPSATPTSASPPTARRPAHHATRSFEKPVAGGRAVLCDAAIACRARLADAGDAPPAEALPERPAPPVTPPAFTITIDAARPVPQRRPLSFVVRAFAHAIRAQQAETGDIYAVIAAVWHIGP